MSGLHSVGALKRRPCLLDDLESQANLSGRIRRKLVEAAAGVTAAAVCLLANSVLAQQGQFVAKPLVEKKSPSYRLGELYWRIDTSARKSKPSRRLAHSAC